MNTVTANALLKALEEPPPETIFFLVTDALDRLLPTVLSRCQKLTVPVPDQAQSLAWLEQASVDHAAQWLAAAGGAPLRALEMSQQQSQPCPAWAVDLMAQVVQPKSAAVGKLADELAKQPAVEWFKRFLPAAQPRRHLSQCGIVSALLPPPVNGAATTCRARVFGALVWACQLDGAANAPCHTPFERQVICTFVPTTFL